MSDFRKSLHNGTHKKIEGEEDLNYLFEEIKNLYKVEAKDEYGNVIIDEETKKPKLVDSLRRSGKPKYTHPYNVAQYLYNKGYSREYVITALFHDVLEDTKYTENDIRRILGSYWDNYHDAIKEEDKDIDKDKNQDKEEFITKIINAVNCVTKKGKISRPKAPILKLKNKIKIGNVEIEEVTVHELLEKKQITRNFDGILVRQSLKDLNKSDLTEESQKELEIYIRELLDYNAKMPEYIKGIKESENDIARIVKVADRISNLTDFSPTDDSNWLEKYTRETVDFFLDLASGTDLEQDFMDAIRIAREKKLEKEEQENIDRKYEKELNIE